MFLLTAFVFSHICSVFANFRHRFIVSFIYSIAEIKVKAIKYKKTDERLGLTNRKKNTPFPLSLMKSVNLFAIIQIFAQKY